MSAAPSANQDFLSKPLSVILTGDHSINMKLKLKSLGNIEAKKMDEIKGRLNKIKKLDFATDSHMNSPRGGGIKPLELPTPRQGTKSQTISIKIRHQSEIPPATVTHATRNNNPNKYAFKHGSTFLTGFTTTLTDINTAT